MPGLQNQVDIQITSTFNPAGFVAAKEALATLNTTVSKTATGMSKASGITKSAATAFGNYANFARGATSAVQECRTATVNLGNGMTMMGSSIKNANESMAMVSKSADEGGQAMVAMASKGESSTSKMGSAMNGLKGYMGGLIKQTISVGDIFGFYIGMMAVNAVYGLTIGMSKLRNEMETTFEYMGKSTKDTEKFSNDITLWAASQPKLSIAGVYQMARVQAMSGATLDQIDRWKQTWGDVQAIGASLLDLSPEAAAERVGPAITEAVEGRYKRLTTLTGITTTQFKKAAADMGISAQDLQGNYDNTMKVLQSELVTKHLAGVAGKLTSFADAWDYMSQIIGAKSSMALGTSIGSLAPVIKTLGDILLNIPGPMFLLVEAFIALVGIILVGMPVIASLVSSMSILGAAFEPISTRIDTLKMNWANYEEVGGSVIAENTAIMESFAAMDSEMGALNAEGALTKNAASSLQAPMSTMEGKQVTRTVKWGADDAPMIRYFQTADAGTSVLGTKLEGVGKDIENNTQGIGRFGGTTKSQMSGATGVFSKMGGGLKGVGSGIMGIVSGIGAMGKAMIMFLLTDPIGWIILIIAAIVAIITITGSWGKVINWLKGIWAGLEKALGGVWKSIVAGSTATGSAIQTWKGWGVILAWITNAWNQLYAALKWVWGMYQPLINIKMNPAFKDAVLQLSVAWNTVKLSLKSAWTALQPALKELGAAFGELYTAIFPVSDAINKTANTSKKGAQGFNPMYTVIHLIVDVIKLFAWGMIHITIPAIKLMVPVIKAIIFVFKELILGLTWLIQGWRRLDQILKPVGGAMVLLAGPFGYVILLVQTLWHWITGNSPGLVPAFLQLLAITSSVFPAIASIIGGAINAGIAVVMKFVGSVVAYFRSLPGNIYNALAAIKTEIIAQLQAAYDGAMSWVAKFVDIGTKIKDYVVNGIKSALGIKSPSKVTMGLGEEISKGLYQGMSNWVTKNAKDFTGAAAGGILDSLKQLDSAFQSFSYKFYYNSLQGVTQTLKTMSGNCSDAADAFMSMASNAGIATTKIHTMVNGIGHYVVGLPQFGIWTDPSGILGHGYRALGTGGIGGAPNIIVNQSGNNISSSVDSKQMANDTARRILQSVRFGI
jgi:hypothetical protein